MFWVAAAAALVGAIALLVVLLAKRRPDAHPLGSVSTHWVTEHRDR